MTPVAIMTSSVKNNHEHIVAICERFEWFGRGRENFRLFEQVYSVHFYSEQLSFAQSDKNFVES
jgi:hypothetical protein